MYSKWATINVFPAYYHRSLTHTNRAYRPVYFIKNNQKYFCPNKSKQTSWAELGHTRISVFPLQLRLSCQKIVLSKKCIVQKWLCPKIVLYKTRIVQKLCCPEIALSKIELSKNCVVQKLRCPKNVYGMVVYVPVRQYLKVIGINN